MDAKAKNYLNRYLDSLSPEQKSAIPSVSADYYCADEYNANVCAELVRIGQKTASCSMELWYREHGEPVCVIQMTDVSTCRYDEVTAEFAYAEGEGDRTLNWWRDAHAAFFKAECDELNIDWHEQRLLVLERFKVVYPSE
ncbi:ASCH domain-containing protein [Vibrio parahaemolyticus]|uniref:ASCH domain-containing protein n=1 Tax=Vibrio parahaemolyticus TaxID=670 RepID=UPI003891BBA4|nr:ASCH domain-containing protein [Vibrio parahaemolyticus]